MIETNTALESASEVQDEPTFYVPIIFSINLYILAIIGVIVGIATAYLDPGPSHKIVGEDAYNFIIYASRGAVLVGASIVVALIALGCQIAGYANRLARHVRSLTNHSDGQS